MKQNENEMKQRKKPQTDKQESEANKKILKLRIKKGPINRLKPIHRAAAHMYKRFGHFLPLLCQSVSINYQDNCNILRRKLYHSYIYDM